MSAIALPSYEEATRKTDWLELIEPYIPINDYARLCRVSRRFNNYFLRKLWFDPFAMCYALGPITKPDGDKISRTDLFLRTVPCARLITRSLVFAFTPRIRDWLSMLGLGPGAFPPSLWFPNLRCLTLLDCPPPDDHEQIIQFSASLFPRRPYVVSAVRCSQLPVQWPDYEQFQNLIVYLDDSYIHKRHGHPHPNSLFFKRMPRLRILKATGHDLGDTRAAEILHNLGRRLWSLDLSNNGLTNRFLKDAYRFFGFTRFRQVGGRNEDGLCTCFGHGHRYELEGSICSSTNGFFIHETPWTEDLRLYHPRRYHEDSPEYAEDADAESREVRKRALDDSLDAVIKAIGMQGVHSFDYLQPPFLGITHLYLNQNPMLTVKKIQRLIEYGFEQLQRFECDSMLFMPEKDMSRYDGYYHDSRVVPSCVSGSNKQAISGILGLSHLFRPVFTNLQILRIHHSLVTNLPSLTGFDDLSAMEKIWFAETFLLPRADLVFPNPFHPDMNPRLRSLTLTHIPRYSTGPLIERFKGLLKAAWFQEQTIAKLRAEYRRVQSRYQPPLLPGLRKIFLEFDPDPCDKQGKAQMGTDAYEGFDAEALLNSGATDEFGTFGGFTSRNTRNGTSGPSTSSAVRHVNANNNGATGPRRQQPQDSSELPRLAAETPEVRAVLQSRYQQWSQGVDRWARGKLDWSRPTYVTEPLRPKRNPKVFIGYNKDSPNQPVLVNNGVSPSGLASSSSAQGPFDSLQSPDCPQEHVEESRTPPELPVSTQSITGYNTRRADSSPPAYTASSPPAPFSSTPIPQVILPYSTTSHASFSSQPLPPPPENPAPLTPIPPCYTSFPYFLSLEEKQASLTTYHLLISRALWLHPDSVRSASLNAGLGGPSAAERNRILLELFHPINAATPSMVRAGVPTQLPIKQRDLELELGRWVVRHEEEQQRVEAELVHPHANRYEIALLRQRSNRVLHYGQRVEELRQATRRAQDQARERRGGPPEIPTGAGCHVFWNAWKAGLFGDVIFPSVDASGSVPCASASQNGHGGSCGMDAAPSTSTSTFTSTSTSNSNPSSTSTERRRSAKSTKGSRNRNRDLLRKDMRRPTNEELSQMKDVIEELKKFRALTSGSGSRSGNNKTKGSESKDKDKGKGKANGKGKGKGKQKATTVGGSEDEDENSEDSEDSESEWAGKHWMGELKVIRT